MGIKNSEVCLVVVNRMFLDVLSDIDVLLNIYGEKLNTKSTIEDLLDKMSKLSLDR